MATQLHTEIIPEFAGTAPAPSAKTNPKKKLIRRSDSEYSQAMRRGFQFAFLLMNIYLGGVFYLWVRQFEPGGLANSLARPAGVEGWLPIAGMMNLKYFILTHQVPALHPAAMFLLVTFTSIAFLFRKAFCSWLCPVGTLSEYLWQAGKKIFRRNFYITRWVDIPLRGLKYLLLGFFVWAVSTMTPRDIVSFMRSPYGIIADVKMLNFFRTLGMVGAIVLGVLVVASVLVQNFWCRYLCPYGALLGLTSLFSPMRIHRNESACIDCAKCAKACPSSLPVDKLITIKSAECTGCLECIAVCPAQGALQMSMLNLTMERRAPVWGRAPSPVHPRPLWNPRPVPAWAMAAGIAVLFFGIVGFAKTAGYWTTNISRATYEQLVPHANEARHPMPGE
jgi:polyferredoxin